MIRTLSLLLILIAGCVPPTPDAPPAPGDFGAEAREAARTAAEEHRVLRAETWREAARRVEAGATDAELFEWLAQAEGAAARAADSPLKALTAESLKSATPEQKAAFFRGGAEGFQP